MQEGPERALRPLFDAPLPKDKAGRLWRGLRTRSLTGPLRG